MKTRTCLLETQGHGDKGPSHRCHHTEDEHEKSLLLLMKTFGNTRDCFIIFALSCLSYLEWIESQIPECNHFTINKQTKKTPTHVYILPGAVPGGEADLEELFGLIDLFTMGAETHNHIYIYIYIIYIYILGLYVYIVDTVY